MNHYAAFTDDDNSLSALSLVIISPPLFPGTIHCV